MQGLQFKSCVILFNHLRIKNIKGIRFFSQSDCAIEPPKMVVERGRNPGFNFVANTPVTRGVQKRSFLRDFFHGFLANFAGAVCVYLTQVPIFTANPLPGSRVRPEWLSMQRESHPYIRTRR